MATPQYGGTGGVPELDVGQPGSARDGAGTARYVVRVLEQPDRATVVNQPVVQQNVSFEDNLGFSAGRVIWEGSLKVDSDARLGAIESELNRYLHGSARVDGVLGPPNPAYLKPTRLTNALGRVLSESARLEGWTFQGPVQKLHNAGTFNYLVPLRVVFKMLG